MRIISELVPKTPKSTREKVQTHRAKLRAQGLRPVQFWLPDTNSPEFIAEARRQSLAVANSPHAAEDQAFIDAISDWSDERNAVKFGRLPVVRTM